MRMTLSACVLPTFLLALSVSAQEQPSLAGFRYMRLHPLTLSGGAENYNQDPVRLRAYFERFLTEQGWTILSGGEDPNRSEARESESQMLDCTINVDASGFGTRASLACVDLLGVSVLDIRERGVAWTVGGECQAALRHAAERLEEMRPRFDPDEAVDILSRLPPVETHSTTAADLDQMARDGRFTGAMEGLWAATDESGYRLGIVSVDEGREFVAVVLESPRYYFWQPGMVKGRFTTAVDGRTFSVRWRDAHRVESTGLAILADATLTVSVGREALTFLKLRPSTTSAPPAIDGDRGPGSAPGEEASRTGTAFLVNPNGLLLTANHVVEGAESIRVACGGQPPQAAIVRSSSASTDLAVLEVPGLKTEHFLSLSQEAPSLGARVFTVGYPLVGLLGEDPKYTEGTVSALSGPGGDASFLQISVPVQPGNSGDPLVNEEGAVVGVVIATASAPAFFQVSGTIPQNINWAVKGLFAAALFSPPTKVQLTDDEPDDSVIDRVREATCLVVAKR